MIKNKLKNLILNNLIIKKFNKSKSQNNRIEINNRKKRKLSEMEIVCVSMYNYISQIFTLFLVLIWSIHKYEKKKQIVNKYKKSECKKI